MDVPTALRILGLEPAADWTEIRAAHRSAIVRTHPDAGGSGADAARVNQAFDVLRQATDAGASPLPEPTPAPTPTPAPATPDRVVPTEDPTDLLMRMAEAAHDVGDVVFVDPLSGLLEVVVGEPPGVGQLTASVDDATAEGVPVSFTLEPLGVAAAPPIAEVVDDLMRRVRRRARS
ncbi:MAG: hypothetical protein AAGE98_19990 [Actinomycetota bacterium]